MRYGHLIDPLMNGGSGSGFAAGADRGFAWMPMPVVVTCAIVVPVLPAPSVNEIVQVPAPLAVTVKVVAPLDGETEAHAVLELLAENVPE
jgi:hypothetical protein